MTHKVSVFGIFVLLWVYEYKYTSYIYSMYFIQQTTIEYYIIIIYYGQYGRVCYEVCTVLNSG